MNIKKKNRKKRGIKTKLYKKIKIKIKKKPYILFFLLLIFFLCSLIPKKNLRSLKITLKITNTVIKAANGSTGRVKTRFGSGREPVCSLCCINTKSCQTLLIRISLSEFTKFFIRCLFLFLL